MNIPQEQIFPGVAVEKFERGRGGWGGKGKRGRGRREGEKIGGVEDVKGGGSGERENMIRDGIRKVCLHRTNEESLP